MMTDPSELDWRIIRAALKVIEGGENCYRSVRDGLLAADPESAPDLRFLDCARLSGLTPPPLKDIVAGIARIDPKLKASGQKIADALCKFGLRVPPPRPRVNRARETAKA